MKTKKVAVIFDEVFLKHNAGDWHPESPQRLKAILNRLNEEDLRPLIEFYCPESASREEILWNHSPKLYEEIAKTRNQGFTQLDPDTGANEHSFEAALKAVGAQKTALRLLFDEG